MRSLVSKIAAISAVYDGHRNRKSQKSLRFRCAKRSAFQSAACPVLPFLDFFLEKRQGKPPKKQGFFIPTEHPKSLEKKGKMLKKTRSSSQGKKTRNSKKNKERKDRVIGCFGVCRHELGLPKGPSHAVFKYGVRFHSVLLQKVIHYSKSSKSVQNASVATPAEPRGEKKLFFVEILGGEKLF